MDELTLADYFIILRRWKRVFLTTTLVLLALSSLFAMRWSSYRSTAVVQIEQSEIPTDVTTPAGTNPHEEMEALADQRISEIEQKVLSSASLIEIITKFDLYAGARQHSPIADIAENMHKKIKLDLVSSTLANPSSASKEELSAIAFKLSFDYSDPLVTQQVTDELVTRFLDEDLKERRTQAQETSAFLGTQIAALESSMSEQEKKIADYEKESGVSRPENLAFNQQAAANIAINLQTVDSQITTIEGTIGSIRAQLATVDPYSRVIADGQVLTTPRIQLKALEAQYATLTAQYGPEYPDVIKLRQQISGLRAQIGNKKATAETHEAAQLKTQILNVQTNLDAAQKTYGPDHPDVVALKEQLQKLEDQSAALKSGNPAAEDTVADADNPAYLQLVAQLHAAEEQHKSLLDQRNGLQAQQANYQKAITENPEAEKEMAALSRDYDNAQMRYRELKEKKMAADMDEQMQHDRTGERLSLIDPPELPTDTHPPRLLLIIGGFFLSLMGGIVSIIAAQISSGSVIGIRHLESIVGIAPLATIPHIFAPGERGRSSRRHTIAPGIPVSGSFNEPSSPIGESP